MVPQLKQFFLLENKKLKPVDSKLWERYENSSNGLSYEIAVFTPWLSDLYSLQDIL